jgi:hypothetical protein
VFGRRAPLGELCGGAVEFGEAGEGVGDREGDGVADGALGVDGHLLLGEADPPRPAHGAGGGRDRVGGAREQCEQRRLAAPVLADDGDARALVDGQVEASDDGGAPAVDGEVARRDLGARGHG